MSLDTRKIKVLFVYPNEREMSTIPPSIVLLSQLLKQNGHITDVFDTTFYKFDDDISIKPVDHILVKKLQVRPTSKDDDVFTRGIYRVVFKFSSRPSFILVNE